jgi:hypothetical protein
MRLDQDAAVASAPPRQSGERAFGFIDREVGAAEFGHDPTFRQFEMLAAKAVDHRRIFPCRSWSYLRARADATLQIVVRNATPK